MELSQKIVLCNSAAWKSGKWEQWFARTPPLAGSVLFVCQYKNIILRLSIFLSKNDVAFTLSWSLTVVYFGQPKTDMRRLICKSENEKEGVDLQI